MLSYQFFELIPQTLFHEVSPVTISPKFEGNINPYKPVPKQVHSKLIGENKPILFVIISLDIPGKIWVMGFTSHTIQTVHINHPYVISDLLLNRKYCILVN